MYKNFGKTFKYPLIQKLYQFRKVQKTSFEFPREKSIFTFALNYYIR